ncbi:hypothetical protein FFWV33_13510 [Flavobacterium faecale]|uniref:Uncharacterized protein n=1 Tax=Flavobacterium faecale TaxID=1355330 RepID=A0A2S1LFJ1_9FLAO|nr:hypothetical protein [Flavobacterium faecale]AWG22469.1 hypothetical protein FFWV33_13510 [Flavobacterium faecale]
MKNKFLLVFTFVFLMMCNPFFGQQKNQLKLEKIFIKSAAKALLAMEKEAIDVKAEGVAIVCFVPGDSVQSWISKMKVVGSLSDEKANLLAIASAKASEMAETLKNSGEKGRKLKTGEFGWAGGVIVKVKSGFVLASFSGAKTQQDIAISKIGLTMLAPFFN